MSTATETRTFPIVEVFGPTMQGEGPLAGVPTYFIRIGLCDYRCSWCDTMYAVLPEQVKENSERLTVDETVGRLAELPTGPAWVTLSGGNPAVHDLQDLVDVLHANGLAVAVETQGSIWRPWLAQVDMLVASPKPPSSGMATDANMEKWRRFRQQAEEWPSQPGWQRKAVKVVVFDDDDYEFARVVMAETHGGRWEKFLSVGTTLTRTSYQDGEPVEVPLTQAASTVAILNRYRWLAERAAGDHMMRRVAVLPQLHTLIWGQVRGV